MVLEFPVAFPVFGVDLLTSIACHFGLCVNLLVLYPNLDVLPLVASSQHQWCILSLDSFAVAVIIFGSSPGNFGFTVSAFTGSYVEVVASISISDGVVWVIIRFALFIISLFCFIIFSVFAIISFICSCARMFSNFNFRSLFFICHISIIFMSLL